MRAHRMALAAMLAMAAHTTAIAAPPEKPVDDTKAISSSAASTTKSGKGVGVITEIDPSAGTVTLKHEPIPALGWPAMTMGFRAVPPSLLNGLKVGQRIGFDANQGNGLPEITSVRKP